MSKGRLVLLAAALTVVAAYWTAAREEASPSGQRVDNAWAGPGPVEGGIGAPTETKRGSATPESPPAEATTIIVVPRSTRGDMYGPSSRLLGGDPTRLALELQRELKRLGCYSQEVNGEWSPATRRAAKDFVDRVNAVLPVHAPDPVLLALLQSERKAVCGATCPAGQDLTKDGRCLPSALLGLPPAKVAALLERADARPAAGDTTASAPGPANATVAPAQAAYRVRQRSSNFGSWLSGLFGW